MKVLLFTAMIAVISCDSSKKSQSDQDSAITEKTVSARDSLPSCIKSMIKEFSKEEKTNPPRQIYSYIYKGEKVYYVAAVCCDNFSDLYNDSCRLIGHPDGGFTGRGDGKFKDFAQEKKNEKLVWADTRK